MHNVLLKTIYTDITVCNTEEPQQKYRLRTVRNIHYWRGPVKHVLLDPNIALRYRNGSTHRGSYTSGHFI